jgi:hypothetical protein
MTGPISGKQIKGYAVLTKARLKTLPDLPTAGRKALGTTRATSKARTRELPIGQFKQQRRVAVCRAPRVQAADTSTPGSCRGELVRPPAQLCVFAEAPLVALSQWIFGRARRDAGRPNDHAHTPSRRTGCQTAWSGRLSRCWQAYASPWRAEAARDAAFQLLFGQQALPDSEPCHVSPSFPSRCSPCWPR